MLFVFLVTRPPLPHHTTHCTCSSTETMHWLLHIICLALQLLLFNCQDQYHVYCKQLVLNTEILVYSGPAWQKLCYMRKICFSMWDKTSKRIRSGTSLNTTPQALVVTDISSSCLYPRETQKAASVCNCNTRFLSRVFLFFPF